MRMRGSASWFRPRVSSLTGTASPRNYTVNASASTSADITPRTLAVSASAQNKIYDGTAVPRRSRSRTTEWLATLSRLATPVRASTTSNVRQRQARQRERHLPCQVPTRTTTSPTLQPARAPTSRRARWLCRRVAENKIYDGITTAAVTLADDRVAGDCAHPLATPVRASTTRTSVTPGRSA
jgi:hypothetical protein